MSQMHIPAVSSFEQLALRADKKSALRGRLRAALVVPSAAPTLKAMAMAAEKGWIEPILIGDEALAHRKAEETGVSTGAMTFIDLNQPDMAIVTAAQMAARGELDLIVKGRGSTVDFLRLILSKEAGFVPKGNVLSHITVMKPRAYPKLLFLTDAGVVPRPDLKTKIALINNLAAVAACAGVEDTRIAVLAAVEVIYPQMQATVDAAVLDKMSQRGQIRGAIVDGPLSFDCAIDPEAAEAKGITGSRVAGQADALLAPNIETANGVYKAMHLFGHAEIGGVLIGGQTPVALNNRYDDAGTRLRSILLAVLAA